MIYLILAILSSMLVSVLMRLSSRFSRNGMTMLAANYVMCTVAALALAAGDGSLVPEGEGLPMTLLLGGVSGVLYLLGFVLLRWNIGRSGVVLSATFQKLGVLVPTIAAVTIFHEQVHWLQLVGVAVAVAAILVMHERQPEARAKGAALPGLIALMLCGGVCDVMSKVFENLALAEGFNDLFLVCTFGVALALCAILCVVKKQGICWGDVLCGMAIGVPNYMSARFLLLSLGSLEAVVVYPTFSVGTIVLVTLVGVLAFREKLNLRKGVALGMILGALVLMNMKEEEKHETPDHGGQRIAEQTGDGAGAVAGE